VRELRPDETLLQAIRGGDLRAFDELYARYERRLFGYVLRFVGDPALAEDLFQDILLRVLEDRTFDPECGRFSAWLFTVARNRCLMDRRRRERAAPPDVPEPLHATRAAIDGALEREQRVHAAMAGLTEPQRQLLVLKQVGELTYKEIAAIFGVAEGTIKSRLHAATREFRRQLAGQGEGS
jgi:RNA polymerase sigma-70 factor (ECF subfamily)